ncbi:MAG: class I SAM-dependent RNA methyltransferase [Candidatus Omnitrophota bacterium]|nr:class I SAM-dependent RNA methyltransferase [Candidatus Omnitrophota bacterium]
MDKHTILISTPPQLLPYLKTELTSLGFNNLSSNAAGVTLTATTQDIMYLNLHLRCAHHVYSLVKEFKCRGPDELYKEIYEITWEDFIAEDGYVSVFSNTKTPSIKDSRFANLKCKDAVVDRLMKIKGRRPDSGPDRDKTVIYLYWKDDYCYVYLDTSGETLARRNYRKIPYKAPMQETLAAAVIMATGYAGNTPFINPMCGSGTLAIEATLIALNRAPGLTRDNFGFMHIKGFDKTKWENLRKDALSKSKKSLKLPVIVTDIDNNAIEAAKKNANAAGLGQFIEFKVCDFTDTPMPKEKGIVVINPEYGERLGVASQLQETYKKIGDFFKQKCIGYTAYIFTGNLSLAKKVGLRASQRLQFFNAAIECRLLRYEIYEGTRKK